MGLVNSHDCGAGINDGCAKPSRLVHEPSLPPSAANRERWYGLPKATWKNKEVAVPGHRGLRAVLKHEIAQAELPTPIPKIPQLIHTNIPSPANHQELSSVHCNLIQRGWEITQKEDVRVHITQHIVRRKSLSTLEDITQEWGAELPATNVGNMPQSEVPTNRRGAGFVAKKNDFRLRAERGPARDCVPLDDSDMSLEGLRSGENRHHECRILFQSDRARSHGFLVSLGFDGTLSQRHIQDVRLPVQVLEDTPAIDHRAW